MARSLGPYIKILEDMTQGKIGNADFCSRTIERYVYTDKGVAWEKEWGEDVATGLEQVHGDAEVVYPEAPEESYISVEELLKSCLRNLNALGEALRRRGLDPRG